MSSPNQDTRMSTYTYNVAGLPVHVHYPPSLVSSATFSTGAPVFTAGKPISVLIFLHGRLSRSGHKMMVDTARDAFQFAEDKKQAGQEQREFIVVTFDHRNHGERMVDPFCNEGWTKDPENEKHNERHAIDMYGLQTGTARDVSFVIDFLPAYLFPNDERTVAEWVVSGISLGGHSTWLVLAHEPRVRIGIPIIGCPDYHRLIGPRATYHGLALAPPTLPSSLRALIAQHDPPAAPASTWAGKRILVLSGKEDPIVPWDASRAFVDALDVGPEGRKEVQVLAGFGHEYPPVMRAELIRFFWEEALASKGPGAGAAHL